MCARSDQCAVSLSMFSVQFYSFGVGLQIYIYIQIRKKYLIFIRLLVFVVRLFCFSKYSVHIVYLIHLVIYFLNSWTCFQL